MSIHGGQPSPLTVRIISRNRDLYFDLAGGNRIPKISERRARNVAELERPAVGADRMLFVHDGSSAGHDLFQAILTTLDPEVSLTVARLAARATTPRRMSTTCSQKTWNRPGN